MKRRAQFFGSLLVFGAMGGASCGEECNDISIEIGPGEHTLARLDCRELNRYNGGGFRLESDDARALLSPISQIYFNPENPGDAAYTVLLAASPDAKAGEYRVDYSVERALNGLERILGRIKVIVRERRADTMPLVISPPEPKIEQGGSVALSLVNGAGAPYDAEAEGRSVTWFRVGFDESSSRPEYLDLEGVGRVPGRVTVTSEGAYQALGAERLNGVTYFTMATTQVVPASHEPGVFYVTLMKDNNAERVASGTRINFTARPHEATGDVTYAWAVNGQDLMVGSPVITLAPTADTHVRVIATDAAGHTDDAEEMVRVEANNTAPFTVTVDALPGEIPYYRGELGDRVYLSATVSVPNPNYVYTWTAEDTAVSFESSSAPMTWAVLRDPTRVRVRVEDPTTHGVAEGERFIARSTEMPSFVVSIPPPTGTLTTTSAFALAAAERTQESMTPVSPCDGHASCSLSWLIVDPTGRPAAIETSGSLSFGPAEALPQVVTRAGRYTVSVVVRRDGRRSRDSNPVRFTIE